MHQNNQAVARRTPLFLFGCGDSLSVPVQESYTEPFQTHGKYQVLENL